MLEAEAYRTECQLDYEPGVVDAGDYRFRPVGECAGCDEPTEVAYTCSNCSALLCPNCVSASVDLIDNFTQKNLERMALCPECLGACCAWYPTECFCDFWCTAVKAGDTCPNEGCGGVIPDKCRSAEKEST